MTRDEEIKQKAEEYAHFHQNALMYSGDDKVLSDAYIAGAHSCDKEIELLRNSLSQAVNMLRNGNDKLLADYTAQKIELDQLRNPWISVEDRLPDEFEIVFVSFGDKHFKGIGYISDDVEEVWYLERWGHRDDVTHWMPIPELPEGGAR